MQAVECHAASGHVVAPTVVAEHAKRGHVVVVGWMRPAVDGAQAHHRDRVIARVVG